MKKNITKVIAIFATLCMMTGYVFAADADTVLNSATESNEITRLTEYEELLNILGIIDIGEEYDSDEIVTKNVLLQAVLKMIKTDVGYYNSGMQLFFDVSPTNPDAQYVEAGYKLGIVNGDGTGFLGIYDEVDIQTAGVMVCRGLGYSPVAESAGGYIKGYDAISRRLGLYDGVIGKDGLITLRDMAQMLYNALTASTFSSTKVGQFYLDEGGSLMGSLYNIEYTIGVVESDMKGNIYSGIAETDNRIVIEGDRYNAPEDYIKGFLGYRVKAYYKVKSGESVHDIVYMFKYNNRELAKNSDDVIEYAPGIFRYIENDKERDVTVSPYAVTLKNGNIVKIPESTLPVKNGSYTLIDNDNDGSFDVVIIKDYRTVLVKDVSVSTKTIYDKGDGLINLGEYERFDICDAQGGTLLLENISENDVLRVEAAEDKSYIDIVVCRDVRSTAIKTIKTDSINGYTYYVYQISNGEEVRTNPDFGKFTMASTIKAGGEYTFYFDCDGNVVYAQAGASVMKYGYLTKWAKNDEPFAATGIIKIFTTEGKMETFTFEDSIKVTGLKEKVSVDGVLARITESQLVRYRADENNVLKEIEFVAEDTASSGFTQVGKVSSSATSYTSRYYSNMGLIGGTLAVNKSTIIFVCPTDEREERYTVGGMSMLVNQGYYPGAEGYCSIGANTAFSEVVVIPKGDESITAGSSPTMVVSHISEVYDAATEENATAICGFYNGSYTEYKLEKWVEPKCYLTGIPIEEGDVIRYEMGSNNSLAVVQLIFDHSSELMYNASGAVVENSGVEYGQNIKLTYGRPASFVDNYIKIEDYGYMYYLGTSSTKVYEYDAKGREPKLRDVTVDEIIPTEYNPGISDKVLIVSNYQTPICVVIYK